MEVRRLLNLSYRISLWKERDNLIYERRIRIGKGIVKNANDYADIKSNPVVESVLMPIVKAVPVIGDMIDSSMNKVIEEFQEKKENELIEVILKDKTVSHPIWLMMWNLL